MCFLSLFYFLNLIALYGYVFSLLLWTRAKASSVFSLAHLDQGSAEFCVLIAYLDQGTAKFFWYKDVFGLPLFILLVSIHVLLCLIYDFIKNVSSVDKSSSTVHRKTIFSYITVTTCIWNVRNDFLQHIQYSSCFPHYTSASLMLLWGLLVLTLRFLQCIWLIDISAVF